MKTSLIYSVTVTTLHYLYKDEPREYSLDKTEINCDLDSRSSLFLSFEAAEKRKNDTVLNFHRNLENRLYSICIDEYEEGDDITVMHPRRAWYYDGQGQLVKELIRVAGTMVFASEKGLPNVGDIVELQTSPTSIGLGIIASVPNHRNDYIGNLSIDNESQIREVPYDPHCYIILTGREDHGFNEYESVDFMPYSGPREIADFMKGFIETYKKRDLP